MSTVSAKVTSKGQITLPAKLRRELGIRPGDSLEFRRNAQGHVEIMRRGGGLADLKGILKTDLVLTDEEIAAASRTAWGARWQRYVGDKDGDDNRS